MKSFLATLALVSFVVFCYLTSQCSGMYSDAADLSSRPFTMRDVIDAMTPEELAELAAYLKINQLQKSTNFAKRARFNRIDSFSGFGSFGRKKKRGASAA